MPIHKIIATLSIGVFILVGCGATPNPEPTLDPQVPIKPGETVVPTVTPPLYQLPVVPITADNAARIEYIGRLDTLGATPSTVFAHDYSPDGTRLVGLNNDLLIVWDLIQGGNAFYESRGSANDVFYSSDKTELYTVDTNGNITVNDPDRGTDLNVFSAGIAYNNIHAFYERDGWLALASRDGNIQVWDTYQRLSKVTFLAHAGNINALDFSADGKTLASVGQDGTLKIWDWATRTAVNTFSIENPGVLHVAISPDGTQVTLDTADYTEIYSLATSQFLYTIASGGSETSEIQRYSPDGRYIVVGGTELMEMSVLEAQTGKVIAQLPQTNGIRTSAVFSPDSNLLVTTALDGNVSLWNLSQATENTIPSARLLVGSTRITSADWSADGFTLAFFDANGSVFLWGITQK